MAHILFFEELVRLSTNRYQVPGTYVDYVPGVLYLLPGTRMIYQVWNKPTLSNLADEPTRIEHEYESRTSLMHCCSTIRDKGMVAA